MLTVFILGLIIGRMTNDSGRYSYKLEQESLIVFDSSTGIIYVKDNTQDKTKFFEIDVKNAGWKEYKEKNNIPVSQ